MRTADGFLLVFDLSNRKSFGELTEFHKQITRSKDNDFPPMLLAGNKCDLPEDMKAVTASEAQEMCSQWKCQYLEASAKERKNVDECFMKIVERIVNDRKGKTTNPSDKPAKKKGCSIL